jgi:DNA-binding NtrC family response regulator
MRILVAEDEAHNRDAVAEVLRRLGHEPVCAEDGQAALELATRQAFDLIISDVRMPRMDGLEFHDALLAVANQGRVSPPFAFMTAYGRMDEAVEAMRKGALHFLSKPLRRKDLAELVEEVERRRSLGGTKERDRISSDGSNEAVYVSRAYGEAVEVADKVAATLASVLLVGESGTGKEVLARRIHERSGRRGGPFVAFHAGAVPETLLESELFGHEKGAFTGADVARPGQLRAAEGGSFFLDEISSMPLPVQAKLLRVLQERKVTPLGGLREVGCDVRWIAATNEDPDELVRLGRLREDLLHRLRVVEIKLPPLRERPDDVDALTEKFLEELCAREGRTRLALADEARALLRGHAWPGNARELRNVIERAIALAPADAATIGAELLPAHIAGVSQRNEIRVAVGSSLQSVVDKLIEETLRSCGGDRAQAAAILGVNQRTIYRWLARQP